MKKTCALGVVLVTLTTVAIAQEKPPQAKPVELAATRMQVFSESAAVVPLKVQVILSRFKGEKKIASLPYSLSVLSNNVKTSLRMGIEVPVKLAAPGGVSYNYRNVGTNIDVQAQEARGGAFNLSVTVSDSSVQDEETTRQATPQAGTIVEPPAFRSFNATFNTLLRDGQTTQHTTATDPISGEVLKIDVTLNVVK